MVFRGGALRGRGGVRGAHRAVGLAEVLWNKKVKKKVAELLNAKPADEGDDDETDEVAPVGKADD